MSVMLGICASGRKRQACSGSEWLWVTTKGPLDSTRYLPAPPPPPVSAALWSNQGNARFGEDARVIDAEGYRSNVGIVICNEHGQVFWARRFGQQSGQFPQGGIDDGESPEQAMYRELYEEVWFKTRTKVELILYQSHLVSVSTTKTNWCAKGRVRCVLARSKSGFC